MKDRILDLRRKAVDYVRDDDGEVVVDELGHGTPMATYHVLNSDEWPPRHEFTTEWLLRVVSNGEAAVTDHSIELTFANAHAVYRIVDDADHGEQIGDPDYVSAAGSVWGYLESGKVTDG